MNVSQGLVLLASLMIVGLRLQPAILKIQNGIQVVLQHRESAGASIELLNFYSEEAVVESASDLMQNNHLDNVLVISNLGYKFNNQEILFEGVNFSFGKCGLYVIRGQNGVGKSTLFEVIAGLRKPYVGKIEHENIDLLKIPQEEIGLYLAYLPQKPYFHIQTIKESLLMDVELPGFNDTTLNRALDILQILQFDISKHDLNKRMSLDDYLSEGEKAKLGIARTLIRDTKILLLDEPTSSLDLNSRNQLRELIAREAKNRLILLISHDDVFDSISDGILEL
jgi:ATP-binding cassette subfamily B protein